MLRNAIALDLTNESDLDVAIEKALQKRRKDEYGYWSTNARKLHLKYQLFSLNKITQSVFNNSALNSDIAELKAKEIKQLIEEIKNTFLSEFDASIQESVVEVLNCEVAKQI